MVYIGLHFNGFFVVHKRRRNSVRTIFIVLVKIVMNHSNYFLITNIMLDRIVSELFDRKPEYDENGNQVGHSIPKIAWVIIAVVVLMGWGHEHKKHKEHKGQKGGVLNMKFSKIKAVFIAAAFLFGWFILDSVLMGVLLPIISILLILSVLYSKLVKLSRKLK